MSNKLIDLEPIEIIKQMENDRHNLQELIIQCNISGIKKAEKDAAYRKAYADSLKFLLNDGNKYTNVILIEIAKGRVIKEYEEKEKAEITYEMFKEKIRWVKSDMETLRTYLSYQKEIAKII